MKVPVSYSDTPAADADLIDAGQAIATDKAYLRGTQLDDDQIADPEQIGSFEEEWAEPAILPDGRKCLKIYVFSRDDKTNDEGNSVSSEDYPWDDAHVRWIKLIE